MSVQDLYSPDIQQVSRSDKVSDRWHGTSIVAEKNMHNNMELQKAVNINKYQWNKEGMVQAGINPLMNSGDLGGVSQSGAVSSLGQGSDVGMELAELPLKFVNKVFDRVTDLLVKKIDF